MTDLILPRRSVIKGTGILLASLFAGPAIAKYSNLMDINTRQNRLIVAYEGYAMGQYKERALIPSLFNLTDYGTGDLALWTHNSKCYRLVRQAEISPHMVGKFGGMDDWTPETSAKWIAYVKNIIEREREQQARLST